MANKSAEKLYNALKSQGKYTKSFAEFQGLLSDKQRSQKLYTALSNDGLYTKSFSDFSKQFSSGETAPTHPQTTTPKKRDIVADTINMLRTPSSQYTRPQPSKAAGTFEMPSKYDIYHNLPDAIKRHQTPTPLKPEAVMPSVPSNAAESVWAAADKAESADVREKVDEGWSWRKIMQALSSGASVTGGLGDDNAQALETTSVAHLKTHDLQKLSDQAWAALGSKQQQSIINDSYIYLKEQYPDADDKALVDAARKMARAKSDEQMYNLAVEKNMPKSVGEFFLRKAAAASSFGSLSKGYASMMAGTRGDMEAEDTALQKYGAKHKVADIAGSVAGFAVDPLTYASGAVGGAATKVALWAGGKVLSEAAARKMSQTLGGKLLLGAVSGAANFGTFEAGGEALNQYKWGGTLDVDPETGRYVVGDFSLGKVASQMRHGLTMGGLTGAFGTWLGNVSSKATQATTSTLGKLGVRAGELGVGLVGEGTIFATPEFISTYGDYNDVIKSVSDKNSPNYIADDKERSKYIAELKAQRGERMMDIWQDNLAMIAGFKAQHAIKSAGRTISELAASRRGKVGFVERMGRMLDGHPSLALSKEEQAELDKHGYGDLTQMVKEYKVYAQKDGDLPYNKITQLLNDKNVSEAARAKMYYYVTGHSLPMSAVIASNFIDNGDKTYTVQSLGDNGVITSRTYGSLKRAGYEKARIDRQAELNGVAMAEQMFDNMDKAARLKAVCTRLAQDKGVSPETLLWLTRKDPKQMTAAEKRWIKEIEDAANEDAPQGENATVRHIKGVILDEYGVDVDKALRKAADSRTDAEKTAISAYNNELAQAVAERKNAISQGETTDAYRRGYEADTQGMRDAYVAQMYEPSEDNAETLRGVESQITESAKYQAALERDELTQMTHKDGSIHLATLKDKDKDGNGKQVYIVDGDIVMKEDGSGIDADASSKSVIIYDPATGEKKMVSPTAVDGIESLGEVKTAEQREAEINAHMQDTIQRGKDWLEGNVANPVGMQIQLGDGRIATIEAMHEDGSSAIATLPDGTQFLVSKDVLQRIVNNGHYADYKARRDAEASRRDAEQSTESAPETATEGGQPLPEEVASKEEERREYAQGDEFEVIVDGQKMHAEIVSPKDADGRFVVNVDDGESMRTLYVTPEELAAMEYKEPKEEPLTESENPRTIDTEEPPISNAAPTEHTPTALERIPRDEKGNAQFHDVDTGTAWDGLVEMSGNEETAHRVAEASLANAEKKLKAAKALKEKGDTPEELLRSIKENEAAVAEAQRVVAAWKAIVGEKSRREEASKAEVERIERKAAEERERADKEEKKRIEAEKAEEEARVEAERKAEEERKTKEEERKERDENGQPFVVSSDGTTTFGEITEDTGLTAAPIKLSEGVADEMGNGYGLRHIEARHGDQIRKAGFSSVEEFIEQVAKNYDVIKEGSDRNGNKTYRLLLTDKHNNTLMIELSKDGSYWNVNTAGVFKKSYGKDKKEVYNRHTTVKQSAETAETSQADEHSGTQSTSRMNVPTTSTGKGSKKAEKKQEKQSVFDKAKEIADKEEKKRKAEADKPKQKPLTETERKDAEEVAGALGYRVEWVDTMEENGTIDADRKVIRIAKDAENPLVQVLGHEVAHGVKRMDGGKFKALQKAAMEVVGEKEWNERIEKKRKLNAYAEGKLAEEVTCDIVGEALNDKDALKRLAESLRGERGILARLRDAVAKMVEYFKNRGDKEGVRRMKAADKLLAEFESALKEDVAPEQVKPEGVDRSEREGKKDDKTLYGVHNISEEKLRKALKLGGLANPSVAVIDISKNSHEGFGEISLILPSEKVAKRTGKNAGTWQGDAWTPTYPQIERRMSNKGAEKASKDVLSVPSDMYSEVRIGLDRWLDSGEANSAMAYMFLHEKGVAPEPKKIQPKFSDEAYNELKSITAGNFNIYGISKADAQKVLAMYIDAYFDGDKDLYEDKTKAWLEKNRSIVDAGDKGGMRYAIAKENVKLYDEYGFNYRGVQTFVRDVEYDHRNTGVDMNATLNEVEDYIKTNSLTDEFNTWQEGKEKEYGIKEVIFDGFTPSGNRRYIPNTLENVSKIMKKQGRNGATGAWASFPNFAARLMPSYGTLEDIRSKKGLLTSDREKIDDFREKWSKVFFELGMKCQPDATGTFDDYGFDRLSEAAMTSDPQAFLKQEYNVDFSDEDTKRLKKMVKAIKEEYPAMYFETKFERPVMLNEFAAAVVPKGIGDDVRKGLEDAGLVLYEYDPAKKGDRERAANEASASDGIRFNRSEKTELTEEERELRDNLVERMRKGGLDVVTDSEEMQRVIDTENERTRMMGAGSVREHRVYHGSGADFDAFDHSHMGEGEGAQAYGWGTYVTEVEGIGRTYAEQNATTHNDALRALQHDVDAISDQLNRHRDDLKYDEEQLKRANEWRAEAELDYELFKDGAEELKEKYGESSPKYRNHLFNDIYTDEMKRAQSSVKSTEESIQYRKEKIAELEKALKDKQAEIDELPKEFPRHLYTVEIPDDNGGNYLDWNGHPAESLLKDVGSFLEGEGFERVQDSPVRYEKGESTVVLNPNATGADLYAELQKALGGDKKASQALAELGYAGIKYPADYRRGGRKDGAKNYVIFNENDAKITAHTRFLRTAGGEVYGLVKDGRIYLDPKVATSETAVHEYTHLWGDMLRRKDSEQWSRTVKELKNSVLWEEVKKLYPELKTDDEIADEVLSTFSGRRGAERLREEARRVADGEGGVFTKAKAIETLERVKEAIARFWEGVARMFGINRYRSAEELADMAMKDLLDSKNPMKDESGMRKRGEVGDEGVKSLKGEEAMVALDNIFEDKKTENMPQKVSSLVKFMELFRKPVRTFLGEVVNVKEEVYNKIIREKRTSISGAVLPTLENADFAIRDTDGSTLYIKRFKSENNDNVYNIAVVNKYGEVEDYVSSVHIKSDNNLRNKITKGAELLLPQERITDGILSRNNSTPGAKVANYSETAKPRLSRKPGESIFDYASRVSEGVDRSVREIVSARDEYEKKVKSKGFQTKEALQNSMLGLQEFMYAIDHASGNKRYIEDIPDFENPILGENRLSSVNKEEMHQVAKTQFKPLMSAVAKLSDNGKESGELYDYMFAKHGLERDAVMRQREAQKEFDKYKKANPKGTKTIGDFVASLEGKDYAGLTALTAEDGRVKSIQSQIDAIDEQMKTTDNQLLLRYLGGQKKRLKVDLLNAARDAADDIRKAFESNPSHDRSDINELWTRVNEVNGNTLRKLYESGMLTKEAYNDISSMYTNYIPMRGFDQTTSADAYAYLTHGDSAFNAPIKTAKGRSSKADNPIAYMQAMAESAIMQGNRNVLVKQKMLNFVRNHPSDLASVSDVWLQYDSVADEWKPVFPDNIGANDSASVVAKKMEAFEDKMKQMAEKHPDLVMRSNEAPDIPYKVVEKGQLNEHQVLVKQNGKSYIITVNGSPRAAQAANGLTNPDTDFTGAVGKVLEGAEALNRQLSSLYTTFNLNFVGSNYVRDALYSNTMVYVKEGAKYGGSFNLNFAKYNPAEMANLYARYKKGSLDTSNETHRLFLEFMQNGGETGFVNLKQIEKRKSEIAKAIKRDGRISAARAWGGASDAIDFANRAVENSARFAAYVTSRRSGRSVGRSVYDAKEISVNFNRKGSGSKFMGAEGQTKAGNAAAFVSGAGRGLYIFWNAGLQGLTNFSRQIGRHPGKALTLAALLFGFGALMSYLGSDDDDDENNYFNLPKYIRRSNVCYKIGDLFVTIPLPVEYRSFYGLGELASSTLAGKEDGTTKDIAKEAVSQVSQLFPIDFAEGGGGLHALIPSAVKPIVEAETNTAWTGLPIYKDNDFNKNMPENTKVYKTTNGHLVEISRALNDATGGNKYKKGFIDINPAKMEYVLKGMLGGAFSFPDELVKTTEMIVGDREFDWRYIPIANRFVKNADERTEYKALNEQYFKLKDEMDVVKQQLKGFEKEADAGNEKYEKALLQLEDSKDYERLELFKDYEKELKGLNDELKELRMSPDYDKAEEKELQKEIAELQRQLIDEMREIKK